MFTIRKVSKMATKCYPSPDFTPAEAFFKILVETAIKRETITYGELVAESEIRRQGNRWPHGDYSWVLTQSCHGVSKLI
ncbi:MAG TPA: hypothetical protein DEP13_05925 [Gammaproteobacteria bacterium]|nr:hypothetical protein [Gammaproteobacteria bacterium]